MVSSTARQGGMATGAVLPNVDDQRRFGVDLLPVQVREWNRGVAVSIVVQEVEEQPTKTIDLIRQTLRFGKNRVVHATCSTKCMNQI